MDYVIYLLTNGEIVRSFSGPADTVGHQLAPGEAAAAGLGTWATHRVESGVVVELPTRRLPPFEGAHWDPQASGWFDPAGVTHLRAAALADRRQTIIGQIATLEAQQQRPIREVTEAWLAGTEPPEEAAAIVLHIASSIRALRDSLKGLQE